MPLPPGFVLEEQPKGLPPGFVLEPESPVQKLNKTQLAALPQFKLEQPSWLERNAATLYSMVEPFTPQGLLSQSNRLLGLPDPTIDGRPLEQYSPLEPLLGPPQPQPYQPFTGGPPIPYPEHPDVLRGASQAMREKLLEYTSLGNIMTYPAFVNPVARLGLAGKMTYDTGQRLQQIPQQATELGSDPNASAGDLAKLLTGGAIDLGAAYSMAKFAGPQPPPAQSLGAEAFKASQRPGDVPIDVESTVSPPELPLLGTGQKLLDYNAPRFAVNSMGHTADLSQLTPKEQTELLRGPREFVPREQYVRPAQAEPQIVKPAATTGQILGLPEGFVLEDQSSPLVKGPESEASVIQEPKAPEGVEAEAVPQEGQPLKTAAELTSDPGHALHGGIPIKDLADQFKKIRPYLSQMNDNGLKTVYSEHGLSDQADVPYVVFSKPTEAQVEQIQKAAEHVGGSVQVREGRTGVYFKGGTQKEVMQDWADFTHKLTTKHELHAGAKIEKEDIKTLPSISKSAYKDKEGNIYTGLWHYNALEKVPQHLQKDAKAGFTTKDGNFVTREEAAKIARKAGQMYSRAADQYDMGGLTKLDSAHLKLDTTDMLEHKLHAGAEIEKEDLQKVVTNLKDREKDLRGGTYQMSIPRMMVTPGKEGNGFSDSLKPVDGTQLWNRAKNKHAAEASMLEEMGVADKIKGQRLSPAEAAKIVQENGPKVEVKKFGDSQEKVHPKVAQYRQLLHEFYDNLKNDKLMEFNQAGYDNSFTPKKGLNKSYLASRGWTSAEIKTAETYWNLAKDPEVKQAKEQRNENQAHWSSVAPKPEKDMPGYVEIAVTKDAGKVHRGFEGTEQGNRQLFPASHSFPPNTLAWTRAFEDKYGDIKIGHVVEVQSDWAEQRRKMVETMKQRGATQEDIVRAREGEGQPRILSRAEAVNNDPLLAHYERLAAKATIEHFKSQGAKAIFIPDSKTAMMTEGHDRLLGNEYQIDNTKESRQALDDLGKDYDPLNSTFEVSLSEQDYQTLREYGVEPYQEPPPQAKGMELHYDKTLQKVYEELTGSKGEPISLGEHKMALNPNEPNVDEFGQWTAEGPTDESRVRKDLYFRNEDGSPKTDITGKLYPLEKTKERFSLVDKDKPDTDVKYLYAGMKIPGLDKVWEKLKVAVDPTKAVEAAKELVPKVLDQVYGHGVKRDFSESIEHLKADVAGYSAPHHVAVSETLANKMIEYAAADQTASLPAATRSLAPTYKKDAMMSWLNEGVKQGVYKFGSPDLAPMAGGKAMEKIPLRLSIKGQPKGQNSLYVRADLAPEVKQVVSGQGRIPSEGVQFVLKALTKLQLMAPTDLVVHSANMFGTVARSQGKYPNIAADLVANMPIVKQIDAAQKLAFGVMRIICDNPATQDQLLKLSKLDALRPDAVEYNSISSRIIKTFDRAGRIVRDQMFDNGVKMGLWKDTPLNRREFVNKMGQYNTKMMTHAMATLRNYTSQFVVAGRRMNRNAREAILMQNELKAASPGAYAQMKFNNILSVLATWIGATVVLNMAFTGKPFGRPGTPTGKVDTGKDSDDGRPLTIDLAKTDLSRRGARNLGIEAVINGIKQKKSVGDTASDAIWDIINGHLNPWMGPPVRPFDEARKEYAVSHDANAALWKGASKFNPMTVALEKDEKGKHKGAGEYAMQLAGSVGYGKGYFLTHIQRLEKDAGKPVNEMSLKERVLAEQHLKEVEPRLSEEVRAKTATRPVMEEYKTAKEIRDSLSKADRGFLESRELSIPGFRNIIEVAKTELHLTPEEQDRYKQYVKEEYVKAIEFMRKDVQRFDALPKVGQQQAFIKLMIGAKKAARGRLLKEMDSIQSGPK